jgi:hypothetical protein
MHSINRTAILFQPKQPFIDWLNRNEESGYVYKIAERRNDCSIYLIEEIKSVNAIKRMISLKFKYFFEQALDKYPFSKDGWPDTSSLAVFEEWIDVTYHTIVLDMCDLPLVRDSVVED